MEHAQLVNAIKNGFQYPTLPKHLGKPDYMSIRDTHRLLTAHAASTRSPRGGGQNGYLGITLATIQYVLTRKLPLVLPTNPGQMPNITAWTTPFDEKALIREHNRQRRQYHQCRNVYSECHKHILTEFEYTYLSP